MSILRLQSGNPDRVIRRKAVPGICEKKKLIIRMSPNVPGTIRTELYFFVVMVRLIITKHCEAQVIFLVITVLSDSSMITVIQSL